MVQYKGITLPVTHSDHEGSFVQAIEYAALRNLSNPNAYIQSNKLLYCGLQKQISQRHFVCDQKGKALISFLRKKPLRHSVSEDKTERTLNQ